MKVKEVLEKISYDNYDTIYISNKRGEVLLMISILNMSEEIEQMEVEYYECDFEEIYIVVKDNTYSCDICGDRKNWDEEIIWITSSYGVCKKCYQKLTEEELEKIREEYE